MVSEFAIAIKNTRKNFYKIFQLESTISDLLRRISKTLKRNLFSYYAKNVSWQFGIDSLNIILVKPDFSAILNATSKTKLELFNTENYSLKRENEIH